MIREQRRVNIVSVETLCEVMTKMATQVEEKIKPLLSDNIELVFHASLCECRYFVAVYASFRSS